MSNCVLSAEEAARRLNVSLRTLARLKKAKALPYVVLSRRHHVFLEQDVAAFIASRVVNRSN